jgi:hypothetical protein
MFAWAPRWFGSTPPQEPIVSATSATYVGDTFGELTDSTIVSSTIAKKSTKRPDSESLKILQVQEMLTRRHTRLIAQLPRALSRERWVKRVRLAASLTALVSSVGVLGALGFGDKRTSIVAAVITLLVSGLKIVEDHLIAGVVTGKEPHRHQAMVIEGTRLSYEAADILITFKQLNAARALPKEYPLTDANRIAKDLLRILPEMEVAQNS